MSTHGKQPRNILAVRMTPAADQNSVEMPRPTASPLVLCLGLTLLAAGAMLGLAFLVVGALVLVTGLGMWVAATVARSGPFTRSPG